MSARVKAAARVIARAYGRDFDTDQIAKRAIKAADRAAANTTTPGGSKVKISELQALAYKQSADKGFHDDEPTEGRALLSLNAERIALMHSELSEALEELRSGRTANETYYPTLAKGEEDGRLSRHKPEGVPSELADVVIRVMDFCGANGIDLESMITEKLAYNATRGHKHGKHF